MSAASWVELNFRRPDVSYPKLKSAEAPSCAAIVTPSGPMTGKNWLQFRWASRWGIWYANSVASLPSNRLNTCIGSVRIGNRNGLPDTPDALATNPLASGGRGSAPRVTTGS